MFSFVVVTVLVVRWVFFGFSVDFHLHSHTHASGNTMPKPKNVGAITIEVLFLLLQKFPLSVGEVLNLTALAITETGQGETVVICR